MACEWAKCTGVGRPAPKKGYDLDAVPGHPCLHCGEPIGQEPYTEYPIFARFGDMFLFHARCDPGPRTPNSELRTPEPE